MATLVSLGALPHGSGGREVHVEPAMTKRYGARFSLGDRVRVASRGHLERFKREWRYHDPLTDEQISYASVEAPVKEVDFYFGGEPLYQLEGIPGTWHEECLTRA